MRLTDEEILAVANHDAGLCLCGHFESCSVCSRSDKVRAFEQNAKRAALMLLRFRHRSVRKRETGKGVFARSLYEFYTPMKGTMNGR